MYKYKKCSKCVSCGKPTNRPVNRHGDAHCFGCSGITMKTCPKCRNYMKKMAKKIRKA